MDNRLTREQVEGHKRRLFWMMSGSSDAPPPTKLTILQEVMLCDLALSALRQDSSGGAGEEKIADLLTDLELLNFMEIGAPRHQRKKQYDRLRAFLISLAPGVVEPNFEKEKK